jgi:DNA-binding NtrC family response regulator
MVKRKILVVDDDGSTRKLLEDILSEAIPSAEVMSAESGTEAWEIILKNNNKPDVVISDIEMPGSEMDGIELLYKIKNTFPEIKVIIMTGRYEVYEKAVSRLEGKIIPKPFPSLKYLLKIISQ